MHKLPEQLHKKIIAFERLLFLSETAITISAIVLSTAIPLLILFVSDRFADTPKIVRVLLLSISLLIWIISSRKWLLNWLIKKRSLPQIAIIIQRKIKNLGDKLQSAVELSYDNELNALHSEELRQAALRQITIETEKYNFSKAINSKKVAKFAISCLVFAFIIAIVAKFAEPALRNSFSRFVNPFNDTARFTFVNIEHLPKKIFVPISEQFEIKLKLSPKSLHHPKYAHAKVNGNKFIASKNKDIYSFVLPGISNDTKIYLRNGDWRGELEAIPLYRPYPKSISSLIHYPDYIGKMENIETSGNIINIIEGASFSLSGKYNRNIASISSEYHDETLTADIKSDEFEISKRLIPKDESSIIFQATDIYGISQKMPTVLKIKTFPDTPPVSNISGIPRHVAILQEDIIEIQNSAEDDYGLKYVEIDITVFKKSDDWVEEKKIRKKTGILDGKLTQFKEIFSFSPKNLGIEAGRLAIVKLATNDFFPDRLENFSPEKYIYVLTEEEHFNLLVDKFKNIADKIQNLRNSEHGNLEKNKSILELNEEKLSTPNNKEEIKQISHNEELNKQMTEKLCEEGAETLKEALKNNSFDAKMAEKWSQIFSKLSDLASKQFKSSSKSLQNAAKTNQSPREDLKNAEEKQNEIIEKLDELIQETTSSISETIAASFAARLREQAKNENTIQFEMKNTLKESAGITRKNATAEIISKLDKHCEKHSEIRKEINDIRYDMSAVFKRLPNDAYKIIIDAMDTEKIMSKLSENENMITENKLSEAISQCKYIETKLEQWADILEAAAKGKSSGNPSNSMNLPMEIPIEMMKALLKETRLRKNTRELDNKKINNEKNNNKSMELSEEQRQIKDILAKLKEKYGQTIPNLNNTINKIAAPMTDAEILLANKETGEKTIAAETEAIELLAATLSNMTSQSQMMSMLASSIAGNIQGFGMTGDSSTKNIVSRNTTYSQEHESRKIDKSFKNTEFYVPQKFRAFYEEYLKKIGDEK